MERTASMAIFFVLCAGLALTVRAQYGPPSAAPTTPPSTYTVDVCQNAYTNDCWQKRCRADAYGGYICEPCPYGYKDASPDPLKPGRVCQPEEKHPCSDSSKNDCDRNAECRESSSYPDGYTCCCKSGYTDTSSDKTNKPGRRCEPLNPCSTTNDCAPEADCEDTGGGTYTCKCRSGYVDNYPVKPGRYCKKQCQRPYVYIPGDGCAYNGCGYPEYNTCGPTADCQNSGHQITCVPRGTPAPPYPQPQPQPEPYPQPRPCQPPCPQPCPRPCPAPQLCPQPCPDPCPRPCPAPDTTTTTTTTTTVTPKATTPSGIPCGNIRCSEELFEKCCDNKECCCETGYGRKDSSQPCAKIVQYQYPLLIITYNGYPVSFNRSFADVNSDIYKEFVRQFLEGITAVFRNTPYWDNLIKIDVLGLKNPAALDENCDRGIWVDFIVTFLARNTPDSLTVYRRMIDTITNRYNNSVNGSPLVIEPLQVPTTEGGKYKCQPVSSTRVPYTDTTIKPTAYPSVKCKPELGEIDIKDVCVCMPGKYRRDPDKPCVEPDKPIRIPLCVVREGYQPNVTRLTYNSSFGDHDSDTFKAYAATFEKGIRYVFTRTGPLWTDFLDAKIADVAPPGLAATYNCDGLLTEFLVYFNKGHVPSNVNDVFLTIQEIIRSHWNYSIGGTPLWIDWITIICHIANPCPITSQCIPSKDGRSATCICIIGYEDNNPANPGYDCIKDRCADMTFCEKQNATCKKGECVCPTGWIKVSESPYARDCGYGGLYCLPANETDLCCLRMHHCVGGSTCVSKRVGIYYSYECRCLIGQQIVAPDVPCPSKQEGYCAYCNNHGTCVTKDNQTVTCVCETWYVGAQCGTDVREILAIIFSLLFLLLSLLCCLYYCLKCRCWRRRQMVYSHLSSAAESEAAAGAAKEEDLYGKDFSIPRPTVIRDTGAEDEAWRRRQEELQRRQLEQLSGDDVSSEGSEASWEEHYEKRVTTDSRRTETTRTLGGGTEATTAQFRVYAPEGGEERRFRETSHETTERSLRETTEEGGDRFAYAAATASGESHREPRSISAYSGSETDYDSVASSENVGENSYDKRELVKRSRHYEPEASGRGGTVRYGQEVTTRIESKEHREL